MGLYFMIKNTLHLSILAVLASTSINTFANDDNVAEATLDTIVIEATSANKVNSLAFAESQKASDMVISKEKLKSKSATLGNALAGESGIHSNPFGGGASAPVIRGQEGVRVKILQNGTDVVDMSSVSPDHAVTADSLLSEQIELVRGSSTLLYATASQAGVVNVIDKRIPNKMPINRHETETFTRYNANNDEKLATVGTTIGLGEKFALRLEGLARNSDDYAVPDLVINKGEEPVKRLPDSYNRSHVGTFGLSWIGNQGFLGASFSKRRDKYGLVGHNHEFDHCAPHILKNDDMEYAEYLRFFPHLMEDKHVSKDLHDMHCGNQHIDNDNHNHENIYGHKHEHGERGPWVDLTAKRFDIRGEWQQPFNGMDKIRLASTYSNYHHDERGDGKAHLTDYEKKQMEQGIIPSNVKQRLASAQFYKDNPESIYNNKGLNTRLDFFHKPIGDVNTTGELKGSWGVQYQTQKSNVKRPFQLVKISDDITHTYGERQDTGRNPLIENTNKQLSLFGVEQYRIKNWTFEGGIRAETQTIKIDYDKEKLDIASRLDNKHPDTTANKQHALSYSAGILWDFKPNYRLSLTGSHNERLPTPMELYYHGKHLATNSYQYGNRHLDKEQSNNFELGLMYNGDKWDYKVSTYYNQFKNYINNENLYREGNLFQRRYTQYPAKIYGIEGEITYRFKPEHTITLYGDYVRGKLYDLPSIFAEHNEKILPTPVDKVDKGDKVNCWDIYDDDSLTLMEQREKFDECVAIHGDGDDDEDDNDTPPPNNEPTYVYHQFHIQRPDRNAPRIPPARLGLTLSNQWNERWSSKLDIMRVFDQNKTSNAVWLKEIKPAKGETLKFDKDKEGKGIYNIYQIPEDKTKGYTMLNFGLDYRNYFKGMEYTLSFNANNLLNEKVYIHNSYLPYVPQMGRNFSIALTTKF